MLLGTFVAQFPSSHCASFARVVEDMDDNAAAMTLPLKMSFYGDLAQDDSSA